MKVEIIKATDNGDEYLFDVHLLLKGKVNQFSVIANVTYVLDYNDWVISSFNSKTDIVPTGKYTDCIKAERRNSGKRGSFHLSFNNRCDVDLVVGGVVQVSYFGDKKMNFSIRVAANSSVSFHNVSVGWFTGNVTRFDYHVLDYTIRSIERPEE